jgi:hypothetical protein
MTTTDTTAETAKMAAVDTKLRRTPDGRATADGRFTAVRHYRSARRGPNDRVADGWTTCDTLTGATGWKADLAEIELSISARLSDEARLRDDFPAATHVYWADNDRSVTEVHLVLPAGSASRGGMSVDGRPTAKLGLVAGGRDVTDADTLAHATALLAHLGHGPLPRLER